MKEGLTTFIANQRYVWMDYWYDLPLAEAAMRPSMTEPMTTILWEYFSLAIENYQGELTVNNTIKNTPTGREAPHRA